MDKNVDVSTQTPAFESEIDGCVLTPFGAWREVREVNCRRKGDHRTISLLRRMTCREDRR